MNLFEVLELGPIVAQNEEMSLIVTINGAYLNLFVIEGNEFKHIDCRSFAGIELSEISWVKATELGEQFLQDVIEGENEK